jgi:regulator of replication initiation timing
MSVESKIKDLLEKVSAKVSVDEAAPMGSQGLSKDSSIKAANSGDAKSPKQGDSEDASYETRDEKDANQGAIVSKSISKNSLGAKGPGPTPNFTTVNDLKSIPQNTGIHEEEDQDETTEIVAEDEIVEDETVVAEDQQETTETEKDNVDIASIFGEDISEEFKQKATSIFEAAVIAKVNNEMDKVTASLEEKYSTEFDIYKESVVEKIDAYLNYVVENYMEENKLAIEQGLRTEIAEDFITGLKALFKEHYIEVPEEKYDVMSDLQDQVTDLAQKLNMQIEKNVELTAESTDLKKSLIIKEMSSDLADTEVNKLSKLLEGVDFENEKIYKEKVSVIKENYFPTNKIDSKSAVSTLVEENEPSETIESDSVVSSYAKALSRTIKRA